MIYKKIVFKKIFHINNKYLKIFFKNFQKIEIKKNN